MNGSTTKQIININIGQAINALTSQFTKTSSSRLDAQVLLSHIIQQPRSWVLAHGDYTLTPIQYHRLADAVTFLEAGIPLPYVLGHWEFFNLTFNLSPDVLIPRPETETLVEIGIKWLQNHPLARNVSDIGTGSGCIAVSLVNSIPDLKVTGVDISEAALDIARSNAIKHDVLDQIRFVTGDLLNLPPSLQKEFSGPFNLITANLPYIPSGKLFNLEVYQREPTLALDGGPDGLTLIRKLLQSAPKFLVPGGLILMEIETNQGKSAIELAQKHFQESKITIHPDLTGRDRVLSIQT